MKDFNKKHLNFCGAQTLVLLNINSTYVFVIRGKRCAPWASLYLDEHGEEDRDLRLEFLLSSIFLILIYSFYNSNFIFLDEANHCI
jgi:hypothetical protein